MKRTSILLGASLAILAATGAQASDLLYAAPAPAVISHGGFYFGAAGGVNLQDGVTGFINPPANTVGGTTDDSTGWNASLKLGYGLGSFGVFQTRIEAELGHLENDGDNINTFNAGGPTGSFAANTNIKATYGLVNLLLDFPIGGFGFTPFIGASAGYAQVDATATAGPFNILDDSDNVFAFGGTVGLSYELSRNVTIDLSYRFLRFQDVTLAGPFAGGTLPAVSEDVDNHQINFGARVRI